MPPDLWSWRHKNDQKVQLKNDNNPTGLNIFAWRPITVFWAVSFTLTSTMWKRNRQMYMNNLYPTEIFNTPQKRITAGVTARVIQGRERSSLWFGLYFALTSTMSYKPRFDTPWNCQTIKGQVFYIKASPMPFLSHGIIQSHPTIQLIWQTKRFLYRYRYKLHTHSKCVNIKAGSSSWHLWLKGSYNR